MSIDHMPRFDPNSWQHKALRKYYYDRENWHNGTTQFHQLIGKFVKPGGRILELGAGETNPTTQFLSTLGTVVGLDIDPEVKDNEYCAEAHVYDGVSVPFEEHSFDAVVSNFVCEHVEQPVELNRQVCRILRPGSPYIFRTPNLGHYVAIVSRLTPDWFHKLVANRVRKLPNEAHDPHPTVYRMNTLSRCRSALEEAGFEVRHIRCIETEPSYAMASRMLFYPLMFWERVLNSSSLLERFRANILCVAFTPGDAAS